MTPILEITDLYHYFGGLCAVADFSLRLQPGQLLGLIGPNGAGKTTVFNLITGVFPVTRGSLRFLGREISTWRSHRITAAGIARTFQNIRLFKDLSALDNVRLGASARYAYGLWDALWRRRGFKDDEALWTRRALELLERLNLGRYADTPARHLPYGEQRRLEIARALISGPRLLLLDEPAAGMNQAEITALIQLVRDLHREFDLSLILIEHQMRVVVNLCQQVVVMDFGETIAQGPPALIQHHPRVLEAYLGREAVSGEQ